MRNCTWVIEVEVGNFPYGLEKRNRYFSIKQSNGSPESSYYLLVKLNLIELGR